MNPPLGVVQNLWPCASGSFVVAFFLIVVLRAFVFIGVASASSTKEALRMKQTTNPIRLLGISVLDTIAAIGTNSVAGSLLP